MRHRGEQVLGDLWLFVVRHLHAGHAAQRGGAAPLGDAAAFRGVEVDEIHGAAVDQAAHAAAGDLALTGRDRHPGLPPHARHHRDVVVPVPRPLEPGDVEVLDEAREADGFLHRPAAIGVHGQDEIGTGRVDAAGPDFILAVDANRGWSVEEAVRFARLVEHLDIPWFEGPWHWYDDVAMMARVRRETGMPVTAG